MRRIHPSFKRFILTSAIDKWAEILKESKANVKFGPTGGSCHITSMAFCRLLKEDYDIPCEVELVRTLIGNEPAAKIFFTEGLNKLMEKAKEHITSDKPDVPKLVGMGWQDSPEHFHFFLNLPEQKEVVDLTLEGFDRPQWSIKCHNYWAKYNTILEEEKEVFANLPIWDMSGCVLYSERKKKASMRIDMGRLEQDYHELRSWTDEQVTKRNIPIFMR
jgi:hypothetical protein